MYELLGRDFYKNRLEEFGRFNFLKFVFKQI